MVDYVSASDRGDNRCLQNVGKNPGCPELKPSTTLREGARTIILLLAKSDVAERDQGRLAHESSPPLHQLGYRYPQAAGHTQQLLHVPAFFGSRLALFLNAPQQRPVKACGADHKASSNSSSAAPGKFRFAMYTLEVRSSDPRESIHRRASV